MTQGVALEPLTRVAELRRTNSIVKPLTREEQLRRISAILQPLRIEQGLSYYRIAYAALLDIGSVHRVFTGKKVPRAATLEAILSVLRVPGDKLAELICLCYGVSF